MKGLFLGLIFSHIGILLIGRFFFLEPQQKTDTFPFTKILTWKKVTGVAFTLIFLVKLLQKHVRGPILLPAGVENYCWWRDVILPEPY